MEVGETAMATRETVTALKVDRTVVAVVAEVVEMAGTRHTSQH